jgi:hypothetical protein
MMPRLVLPILMIFRLYVCGILAPLFEQHLIEMHIGIDWKGYVAYPQGHGGKIMVEYEKAVLDLVKDDPKRRQWLVNQLCPPVMSERKLQKTLNELEDDKKIVKVPKYGEGCVGLETWYMLPGHRLSFEVDDSRIATAIEHLKPILLRQPTIDELAVEVGITPAEAEILAYKLASQTGWYNPSKKIIEDSRIKLGEVLICAARIRDKQLDLDGKSESFDYEEDAHIVEEANRFLKDHLKLLPTLSNDGENVIEWPSETLRYLGDNYIPKDRPIQFVIAINRGTGERIL